MVEMIWGILEVVSIDRTLPQTSDFFGEVGGLAQH